MIGSGFAGLSAASFMAKEGWKVTVIEKNDSP
ncbi:MAG TPA: NAD(P)-binding protein, partial [Chitinophagaceae bacterium]|nr:NAD(P)-binding protein [Chitinophagaceae bacterium]